MKTLLVIAAQAGLAEAVRAMVDPQRYRVVHCQELWEAEPYLAQGTADACVLECDLTSVRPVRTIETIHKRLPACAIYVVAGERQWEWEEEALVQGASQVFGKPLRGRLLNLALARDAAPVTPVEPAPPAMRAAGGRAEAAAAVASGGLTRSSEEMLAILGDFSAILSHSLQAEPLLRDFLLLLRQILGVNRAAIFLRRPPKALREGDLEAARRLRATCAIGLPTGLLEHFDLSLDTGIGGHMMRYGRILRRDTPEVEADLEIQKEFELVGAQVAVPILDRENLVGVAMFDGRLTGEPLVNGELGLIFHLLEQLGLAIKNIWLHDQVTEGHAMMTDVLRHLQNACLVVGWDLTVLQVNEAARQTFARPGRAQHPFEFTDLPRVLGGKVFEVLRSGQPIRLFRYEDETPAGKRNFRATITPFSRTQAAPPAAALVIVEDCTDEDRLRLLEQEAANLRLVRAMADRLSNEVGNAITQLSTHQQLFAAKKDDPDFLVSLGAALDDGVHRIVRLARQMMYLSRDLPSRVESVPLEQVIREAFEEARRHQQGLEVALNYENGSGAVVLQGERQGLKHAFYEVLLNAVQCSPKKGSISVRSSLRSDDRGLKWVDVDIRDAGAGFTPQAAAHATEPFFTTRVVGLGLGLAVCRKIVEGHKGQIEIPPPSPQGNGAVRISLPLSFRPEVVSAGPQVAS